MTALHLAFSRQGLQRCLERAIEGDRIVLLGDGVYAAGDFPDTPCVQDDLAIRGVTPARPDQSIAYSDLVELCTQYNPIVSWND